MDLTTLHLMLLLLASIMVILLITIFTLFTTTLTLLTNTFLLPTLLITATFPLLTLTLSTSLILLVNQHSILTYFVYCHTYFTHNYPTLKPTTSANSITSTETISISDKAFLNLWTPLNSTGVAPAIVDFALKRYPTMSGICDLYHAPEASGWSSLRRIVNGALPVRSRSASNAAIESGKQSLLLLPALWVIITAVYLLAYTRPDVVAGLWEWRLARWRPQPWRIMQNAATQTLSIEGDQTEAPDGCDDNMTGVIHDSGTAADAPTQLRALERRSDAGEREKCGLCDVVGHLEDNCRPRWRWAGRRE